MNTLSPIDISLQWMTAEQGLTVIDLQAYSHYPQVLCLIQPRGRIQGLIWPNGTEVDGVEGSKMHDEFNQQLYD